MQKRKGRRISVRGADDVYLTKKNIAVRQVLYRGKDRGFVDKTTYYPRTAENIKIARSNWGRLRFGRN